MNNKKRILILLIAAVLITSAYTGCDNFMMLMEGGMISFDSRGGSAVPDQEAIGYIMEPESPEKEGYVFAGWYSDEACTKVWDFADDMIEGSMTLYAKWTAGSHTLSFDANDGTGTMDPVVLDTDELTTLPAAAFTRTGYSFAGWATTSDGTVEYADEASYTMGAGDATLYAKWTAGSHTLSFDANGGTGTMRPVALDTDEQTTLPAAYFTKTGYSFAGWATTSDGTVEYADEASYTMGTDDATLYAKWAAGSQTLNFDANGGTGSMNAVNLDTNEQTTLPAAAFTKTGYSFAGWATTSDGTVEYADEASYTMGAGDETLYAKWMAGSQTLNFNANDGTGSMNTVNLDTDEQTTLPEATFTRTGYSFAGWATASDGTVEYADKASYTMGAGDETLYAKWMVNSYTVTLDKQSGSGGTDSVTASYDAAMPTASVSAPSRDGYTFGGYYDGTSGSGTQYYTEAMASAADWDKTTNTTLYAKWTANSYTVTLDKQNGTGGTNSVDASYDTAMPTDSVTAPTRAGYTFGGYYDGTRGSGTQYYTAGMASAADWDKADDSRLYAKWSSTVSFDSQSADTEADPTSMSVVWTSGTDTVNSLPSAPEKTGYTFGGWWTSVEGGGTQFTADTEVAGDDTVYAKWTARDYTISYTMNSGTNDGDNPTSYTIEDSEISLIDPTRAGYNFSGWYSDAGFSTAASTIAAGSNGDKSFYAKWTARDYTISYTMNSGTNDGDNPTSYTIEDSEISLIDPTREGYEFSGWYSDAGFSTAASTIATGSNGDKSFYAKWTARDYTISYTMNSGTNDGDNPTSYTIEDSEITLKDPTRAGYNFSGWYSDAGFSTAASTIAAGSNGDKSFYAKWSSTVSFDSQSADTEADPTSMSVVWTSGTDTVDSLPSAPEKTGYTFGGWWTSVEGGGTQFTADTEVAGDDTVYAKWTARDYTISYTLNSGTNDGDNPTSYTIEDSEISLIDPTREGYEFSGWYSDAGFSTAASTIAAGSNGDKSFYAKWSSTVSFDSQGADKEADPTSTSVVWTSETDTVDSLPSAPEKTGYTFDGWWTSVEGGGTQFTADTEVAGDDTVYAKWKSTVSFDSQSADTDANPTSITVIATSGTDTVDSLPSAPEKTGYTFGGWWTSVEGGGTQFTADTEVAGDDTVYAKWTADSHTLSFDANGGTGTMDSVTLDTDDQTTLPEATFTRTGYSFAGWATSSNSTVSYADEASYTMGAGDAKLYAKWTEDPSVGDVGPAGGYVFYDDTKGYDFNGNGYIAFNEKDLLDGNNNGEVTGDRYLEVAPHPAGEPGKIWGTRGTLIGTSTGVGTGEANTAAILNTLGSDDTAAKFCSEYYRWNGGQKFDDWFLPSKDEQLLISKNLSAEILDGFYDSAHYWSSSESDNYEDECSWRTRYRDGDQIEGIYKDVLGAVRPVRAF